MRTFDSAETHDLASEASPAEDFLARGLASNDIEVLSLPGTGRPVRISSPYNRMLSVTPPPRFIPGFVLVPSRVGYRKVDASGTVKVARSAPLQAPNGVIATDFEPSSRRLLFQTQMGVAVFDLERDVLVGLYPAPPCDDPGGMCSAFLFDGRIFGDALEIDAKAKVWRKTSALRGIPAARLENGETLFLREEACSWLKPGTPSGAWSAAPTFPCPAGEIEPRSDGAFVRPLDHGTLRILDRTGSAVLVTGRHE